MSEKKYISTREKQRAFYKKYNDIFYGFNQVKELVDYMIDCCSNCTEEKAFENLKECFITKDKSIIKDLVMLIEHQIDGYKYEYLLKEFGII